MLDSVSPAPAPRPSVAILYFSGVGGTETVARLLGRLAGPDTPCEILSVEDPRAAVRAAAPGLLVFCYPTYFLNPAPVMADFLRSLPEGRGERRAVLVTTYELYTGNSNRRAALLLRDRGIPVVGSYALRAPGTDVTCVVPDRLCGWLYRFERAFPRKVSKIARRVADLAASPPAAGRIPAPKWYTPLAWALQVLALDGFIRFRDRITVLEDRCSSCGLCVRDCPRGSWRMTGAGPVHSGEHCDLCTRCVHRCPRKALVLVARLKDNRRLDAALYGALRRESFEACAGIGPRGRRRNRAAGLLPGTGGAP